uniref:Heat shock protein 16 n=1 Tax=Griffithsia japonica TaxID=83288 RepID=Q7XZ71_GRIJA|nr:heat shock protein 16 [Griffithsia japonica]|eukprot:GO255429.1.p1 GENE.GO255429.1~~GO255429.1.p1  ORF type:complete len:146 (+),score=1.51 GO255429.1:90-527(+)
MMPLINYRSHFTPLATTSRVFRNSCRPDRIIPSHFIHSGDKEAMLQVELPGVGKEDIEVEVNRRTLYVNGTRYDQVTSTAAVNNDANEEDSGKEPSEKRVERKYSLEIQLGSDADMDGISFESYNNGILTLKIPIVHQESRKIDL